MARSYREVPLSLKLLVARPLANGIIAPALGVGLGPEVDYRPGLVTASRNELGRILEQGCYDGVLLSSYRAVDETNESLPWCEILPLGGGETGGATDGEAEIRRQVVALGQLERRVCHRRGERRRQRLATSGRPLEESRVLMVGAGIVNLVTAWGLVEAGARVEMVDSGPDPRRRPPWLELGATHGGGNARMVSLAEGTCYNLKLAGSGVLRRTVAEGGWSLLPPETLDAAERAWIDRFEALPMWRATLHADDLHRFNNESATLWRGLRSRAPELFEGVDLRDGLLYLDHHPGSLARSEALHRRLGSLQRRLEPREVAGDYPVLAPAVEAGELAGGLEIEGFSLALHRLVDRLVAGLETRGVLFHWGRPVVRWLRDDEHRLLGAELGGVSGSERVRADHWVVSPGAHGDALLAGTRCAFRVQGVLGLWLELPDLAPGLGRALKIHREGHVGEDSNILPVTGDDGRPRLLLGAGYGYLGRRTVDPNHPQWAHLEAALEATAGRFLPRAHARALADGTLHGEGRACLRPFTANGLGLFEVEATRDGGRWIVTTGHNTGGFTQAPAVARAVVATLRGEPAAMADLYDPERGDGEATGRPSPWREDGVRIPAS